MHSTKQKVRTAPLVVGLLSLSFLSQMPIASAYEVYGQKWSNPTVSNSFVPDGTTCDDGTTPSKLFSDLSPLTSAIWQREYAIALQKWAEVTPLNFRRVSDNGAATGTSGSTQNDSRFGDIRGAGLDRSDSFLAYAYYPGGSTLSGDIFLNTRYAWTAGTGVVTDTGTSFRLMGVLIHEAGHSLGLKHSTDTQACMYPTFLGYLDLQPDDIAGIRAIYGARQDDSYDRTSRNDGISSATNLSVTANPLDVTADITTKSDVDAYSIAMPANGAFTASVNVRTMSLLPPKLMVYNSAGTLLGSSVGDYGQDISVNLPSVAQGSVLKVVVMGDTANPVPCVGTYVLSLSLPGGTSTPEPTPEPTPSPTPGKKGRGGGKR